MNTMFLMQIIYNMSIAISSGNKKILYLLLNRHVSWRFFLSCILFMLSYIIYIKKMVSRAKFYLTLPIFKK